MKKVINYFVIFILLIVTFISTLFISCSFSSDNIYNNVKESSDILLKEGNRKIIYIPYRRAKMQFDNYTDALMINTAYSIDSDTPLYSAFIARKNYIPNITQTIEQDSKGELKSASKYKYHDEVGELRDVVNNDITESFEYARYWHGYLTVLRPLLAVFDLSMLRIILTIILFGLSIILLYLIAKKLDFILSIIFFIGLASVEYFYLGFSLQGIFVFLIMMIASIIILKCDKIKNVGYLFFIVGMLTNFFDFLTVPLVTLGVPLILLMLIRQKNEENKNIEKVIFEIIKISILWGIGYAGTWLAKWILVDLIYDRSLLSTALGQVAYRSTGLDYSGILVILANLGYEMINIYISVLITILFVIIDCVITKKKNKEEKIEEKQSLVPYILIGVMPIVWYLVLKNHSINHSFFTYRNLILTILSFNICIYYILKKVMNKVVK